MEASNGSYSRSPDVELSLTDYVQIIRRQWATIAAVLVATLALASLYIFTTEPTYTASSTVLLRTSSSQSLFPTPPGNNSGTLFRSTTSEFEYARSDLLKSLLGSVPATAHLSVTQPDDGQSGTLVFTAVSPSAEDAAKLATDYAATYVRARAEQDEQNLVSTLTGIDASLEQLNLERDEITEPLKPIEDALSSETDPDTISRLTTQRLVLLQTLEGAIAPIRSQLSILNNERSRILTLANYLQQNDEVAARVLSVPTEGKRAGPFPMRTLALAVVAGSIVAIAAAILRENFRNTVSDASDIERVLPGIPILATLPKLSEDLPTPFGWHDIADRRGYRSSLETLISSLQFISREKAFGSIAVIGASTNTGKSTVSYSLALATCKAGASTILVDGDLHRPVLANLAGVDQSGPGLTDVVFGTESIEDALVELPGVAEGRMLTPGSNTQAPSDTWRSVVDAGLVPKLRSIADVVIFDTPPMLAVSDGLVVGAQADTALLVVRADHTLIDDLAEARVRIELSKTRVAGIIFIGEPGTNYYYGDV